MLSRPSVWCLGLAAATAAAADSPPPRLVIDMMRLSESRNYTWNTSVRDDAGVYEITGKTTAGGYTWVRRPMVPSIARKLGRDASTDVEAIFRGPTEFVVLTPDGWKALSELPSVHPDWHEPDDLSYLVVQRFGSSSGGRVDLDPAESRPYVFVVPMEREPRDSYRGVQCALSLPHDELAAIVSSHATLRADAHAATGSLSDRGARFMLARSAAPGVEPLAARGTFKVWLRNNTVAKYQIVLEGDLLIDRRRVHVQETSWTTISAVGGTNFDLPADATSRLGRKRD